MSSVAVNTSLNVNIDFELAGIARRLFAWLIDFIIKLVYLLGGVWLFTSSYGNAALNTFFGLALLLPVMFYFLFFELLMNGQSPGKKIFSIKVVSLEGYKPSVVQYLNRWIFRLMDTGFITIIFFGILGNWVYGTIFIVANVASLIFLINSVQEQRMGDLIAHTVVIRLKSTTKISDTIFTEIHDAHYQITFPDAAKLSDRDISVIKSALQNAIKSNRYDSLQSIVSRLQAVMNIPADDEPYHVLNTIVKDYNYLTTK